MGPVAPKRYEAPKGSPEWLEIIPSVKIRDLTARPSKSARDESRASDPVVIAWKGHRSTDKAPLGITAYLPAKSPHRRGRFGNLDVGSSHLGL